MKIWHAFEIFTEHAILLAAYKNQTEADRNFEHFYNEWRGQIESYSLGTVEAPDLDTALNYIRMDDWTYTQSV